MSVAAATGLWPALWSNVGMVAALTVLVALARVHETADRSVRDQVVVGALFAATGIAAMQSPFPLRPGVLIDIRNVAVVLAGVTGGPVAGLLSGAIIGIYRALLGGQGALPGVGSILTTAVFGAVWHRRRRGAAPWPPGVELLVLGVCLAVIDVAWGLALPARIRWGALRAFVAPAFLFYPAGTLLMGGLLALVRSRAHAVERLRASEERFRVGFALSPAGMLIMSAAGRLEEVNEAFCRMLGRSREQLVGRPFTDVTHPEDVVDGQAAIDALIDGRLSSYQAEKRYMRPDGEPVWAAVASVRLPEAVGEPAALFSVVEDLTERKRTEEHLRRLASTDALTGLPNRKELAHRLDEVLARAERHGSDAAVLFIDLDGFKDVNDHLGHHIGDQLLRAVAHRLRQEVRPTDVVSRVGGDEFVIVLEDLERPDQPLEVARRLLAALARPCLVSEHELRVSACIGIAYAHGAGGDGPVLVQQADMAMYRAKRRGPAQAEIFDEELSRQLSRRYSIARRLRFAVARDELRLLYQPIVSLHTGAITAVEALLRWEHPAGTWIMPDVFVPVAEQTGAIRELGAWVIGEACRQAAEWERLGIEPIPVHINASAVQLRDPGFARELGDALRAAGVAPLRLCVELTETVLMDDVERAMARLRAVSELGVGVAIDDFGTGYSSLAYLQRLPADILKIDRSLVAGVEEASEQETIAEMTLALSRAMGLELIAEGIETAGQAGRLRELGYRRAQGHLFGGAQTAAQLGPRLPRRSEGAGSRVADPPVPGFQIERALLQHPGVRDAATVLAPAQGGEAGESGEEILACIVPSAGPAPGPLEALAAWCEERLPGFAVPRYYVVVDELPRTPSGRTTPEQLRRLVAGRPAWDRVTGSVR